MKNKLYKIFLLGFVLTFASCSKDYLETKPVDQLTEEDMFKNIVNAKAALNGTYRLLYQQLSGSEEDGHAAMMIAMDYLGEDVVFSARGTDQFYYTHRWQDHRHPENSLPLFAYRLYYRIISNANIILERIDGVPDATDREKTTIKGECLSLRAFGHFMLVQLYAKRYVGGAVNDQRGVQIMTKHSLESFPMSTVEEVYKQINDDLDLSLTYLNGAPKRLYKTHIDKSVALGLKARVCLTQQNYADAATFALQAVQNYSLMSRIDYLSGFNSIQNDEWMWGIQQKEEQVPTYGAFYAYMSSNFNSTHTRTNPKMINLQLYNTISATDVRKKMWCDDVNDTENYPGVINGIKLTPVEGQKRVRLMHNKFRVQNPVSRAGDIPLMRASEMYLIAAEALVEGGTANVPAAQDVLYTLAKNRDPLYTKPQDRDPVEPIPSQSSFRTEILNQRRIELWGEGFRFLDLKRRNQALARGLKNTTGVTSVWANVTSVAVGSNAWQFKIPQREIDGNPFLTDADQNP
ncbi:RagB/SusD family nutrient uptake outer membrane protein [Pedobacter sp. UBA4863]|uniref:RagB/SusD family nutrient uptake outer membrane protein n=1 Tax=Pedobacter sp. UBA4863 TaxID=1947060 RepID=UPI0025D07A5E|nr:RagB/SusD family nutrient uptake outer membrane protein [Pedobacter sp. UBA4863]